MKLIFKFSFYFILSFFILSIPINQRTFFGCITDYTSKYTTPIYASVKNNAHRGIERGKKFAKKLFSNSIPAEKVSDSITRQYSAPQKDHNEFELPADSYTVEEKELIRKLTTKGH